jgi:hypothetical protein
MVPRCYFARGVLKLSLKYAWDTMWLCYMSVTGQPTWETHIAVVSEQMMQHLFMWNVTWEVLNVQGVGTDCIEFVMWR